MTLTVIGLFIGTVGIATLVIYLRYFVPLRPNESGFEYVHVELDGTVRELDEEEKEYLKTEFHPADGARPYIKSRYKALTPDGKMWGYLERRRVPRRVKIKERITQKEV